MEIRKRDSKKYPIRIMLSDGKSMMIPKQSEFDDEWLRHHGCSLMAEYVALQWLGVEKIHISKKSYSLFPINLLKWHKLYTKAFVKAKVTVKGVSRGINKIASGNGKATFFRLVTEKRIREALRAGHLVIMEQGNPIHTITLVHDTDGTFMISYGKAKEVSVKAIAKTATSNNTYRGMVVIREV